MLYGPVIQTAVDIALRGGVRIGDVIRTVREAHHATGKPVVVMSYWSDRRYGIERFTSELAEARRGLILPDLPVQESAPWRQERRTPRPRHHLRGRAEQRPSDCGRSPRPARDCLRRLADGRHRHSRIGQRRRGRPGGRIPAVTELPVCVGIGISTAAQAAHVARFADGVIVESVLVKALLDAPDEAAGLAAVAGLTAELADGVRHVPRRPGRQVPVR